MPSQSCRTLLLQKIIMAACEKRKNVRSTEKKDQLARSYKDAITVMIRVAAGKQVGKNPTHNYYIYCYGHNRYRLDYRRIDGVYEISSWLVKKSAKVDLIDNTFAMAA